MYNRVWRRIEHVWMMQCSDFGRSTAQHRSGRVRFPRYCGAVQMWGTRACLREARRVPSSDKPLLDVNTVICNATMTAIWDLHTRTFQLCTSVFPLPFRTTRPQGSPWADDSRRRGESDSTSWLTRSLRYRGTCPSLLFTLVLLAQLPAFFPCQHASGPAPLLSFSYCCRESSYPRPERSNPLIAQATPSPQSPFPIMALPIGSFH
jgi:hypothetical protein